MIIMMIYCKIIISKCNFNGNAATSKLMLCMQQRETPLDLYTAIFNVREIYIVDET